MLTINEILAVNPLFILSVNYDNNLGEMLGEGTNNEYLAEMTIQYHSLINDACLAFTVDCLISVNKDIVTIEQMNTSSDSHFIYASNISELSSFDSNTIRVYQDSMTDAEHDFLVELIENQPIYDAPNNFIIEAY